MIGRRSDRSLMVGGAKRVRAAATCFGLAVLALAANAGWRAESSIGFDQIAPASAGPGWFGPATFGRLLGLTGSNRSDIGVARAALGVEPLAWEPFYVAGLVRLRGAGTMNGDGATTLLREALRRDPRAVAVRVALMRHALADGDVANAFDQIALLRHLDAATADRLLARLAAAVGDATQADQIVAAIAPHPELVLPFLRGLVSAAKQPALIAHVIASMPKAALADPETRAMAIAGLVGAERYAAAHDLWSAGRGGARDMLVRSPTFADPNLPPPFGWQLMEGPAGAAERDPAGGLSVIGYGRAAGGLAQQLLTLASGGYRVRIDYVPQDGDEAALAAQLRCADDSTLLGAQPLHGGNGPARSLTFGVTVPADRCAGQYLELVGQATDGEAPQQVRVTRFTVEPVGQP